MVGKIYNQIVYSTATVNRNKDNTYSICCVLIGLSLLICLLAIPVFSSLWHLWNSNGNFDGLMLVPCMCALILIKRKNELARIRPTPIKAVIFILPVSIGAMLILSLHGYIRLSALFFILNLVVTVFAVFGFDASKPLLAPLLFLTLMVPPSQNFMDFLTVNLQRIFSLFVEALFHSFSDCFLKRESFTIWFTNPDRLMRITPECSGIRSLLGFIIMSSFFAILDRHKFLPAIFILFAGVGTALVMNFARILITMQLRLNGLEEYSIGPWHGFLGILMFMIGCILSNKFSKYLKQIGLKNLKEEE